jgi:hypothetical protein
VSLRARVLALLAVVLVAVGASAAYAVADLRAVRAVRERPPSVEVETAAQPLPTSRFIAFRHTGVDEEYGTVALVDLADPSGPRAFTGAVCDRVDATPAGASCLVTERGVLTKYAALTLDPSWQQVASTPLPGVPSRTRLSEDGSLVATTVFVAGHSYLSTGFSTTTVVREVGGASLGNLEKFALTVDGHSVRPTDRNIWGVTFVDDRTFYATVSTGGTDYLARGDLREHSLKTIAADVECPSLSPDGRRIAFKQAGKPEGRPGWTPAVLDLATGERSLLGGETRNVDDQLEWLDDDTVLYGLARPDEPGVSDVWALDTQAGADPELLVEQAWSPSVVR